MRIKAMNWTVTTLLCLAFCSCTFTIGTEKKQSHATKHRVTSKTTAKTTLVDAQWLAKYNALEAKYNYTIPQDWEIKSEKGKFRVPQSVIDHFSDMTKAAEPRP
jgi:hypothetical protein